MSRFLVAIAAACLCGATVAAPPLEMKGVPLGGDAAALQGALPAATCAKGKTPESCQLFIVLVPHEGAAREAMKFGNAMPRGYSFVMEDGKVALALVNILPADFDDTVAALTAKYGAPAGDRTSEIHNRMGAAFDQRDVTWSLADGTIEAHKRGSTVDLGYVSMAVPGFAERDAARRAATAKAAAGKL
jgi:hypothetical protein